MIRYEAADTEVANICVSSHNDEVKRMAGCVSWLGDTLNAVERLQQLPRVGSGA